MTSLPPSQPPERDDTTTGPDAADPVSAAIAVANAVIDGVDVAASEVRAAAAGLSTPLAPATYNELTITLRLLEALDHTDPPDRRAAARLVLKAASQARPVSRSSPPPTNNAGRLRRIAWGGVDQAASSVTNLLVAVFVARAVSPAEFGRFAAVMLAYQVANGLVRGVVSEPIVVLWSGRPEDDGRRPVEDSLGASLTISAVVAGFLVGIGLLFDGSLREQMILLAVFLPGLQLQDATRFVALAWRRSAVAAASDLVWLFGMLIGGVAVLHFANPSDPAPYLLVWLVCGTASSLPALWVLHVRPRPAHTALYLREHRSLAASYGFESVAQRGMPRLATAAVVIFAGVQEFAGLRGALLFGTQLAVLTQAVRLVTIPESVRGQTARAKAGIAMRAMWLLSGVTTIGSIVLLLVPAGLGRQLLGDTWSLAYPLLIWVLIRQLFASIALGPEIALRAFARNRESVIARLANSVLIVASALIGAAIDGARGAAIGMALGQGVSTVWWMLVYRRTVDDEVDAERNQREEHSPCPTM